MQVTCISDEGIVNLKCQNTDNVCTFFNMQFTNMKNQNKLLVYCEGCLECLAIADISNKEELYIGKTVDLLFITKIINNFHHANVTEIIQNIENKNITKIQEYFDQWGILVMGYTTCDAFNNSSSYKPCLSWENLYIFETKNKNGIIEYFYVVL
jgi:hypothetical protein